MEKNFIFDFSFVKAIGKWLKKKDFSKQPRILSEYSQKRQKRIEELIQETIDSAKKQKRGEEDNQSNSQSSTSTPLNQVIDQSNIPIEIID